MLIMTEASRSSELVAKDEASDWELLQRKAKAFLESGFLPEHIKTLSQALTIAWKGRELGIPPLQAFASITVIKGKPCLSSELMLALCYQRIPEFRATFVTSPDKQNTECSLTISRKLGDPQTFKFTIDDAKRAGVQSSAWTKFPAAMLRARVISAACRAVCPDALMGCYTPEEMGTEIIDVVNNEIPEKQEVELFPFEKESLKQ